MDEDTLMKKALLSYARSHFDPSDDDGKLHSASIIARSLYHTLQRAGYDVEYIDASEAPKAPGSYDLFVGPPQRWSDIADACEGAVKILFMPTGHPLHRNAQMKSARAKWRVPHDEELLPADARSLSAFARADYIMQIGNQTSIAALLENDVPREKILHLHYGVPTEWSAGMPSSEGMPAGYVHTAASLGLRKGLPELAASFSADPFADKRLSLVGEIRKDENYAYWKSMIDQLTACNLQATHTGFTDSSSRKYKTMLAEHPWYLFSSVEEAEPGTVLEAMTLGLVPIVTSDGGIDFALDNDFTASFSTQLSKTLTITPEQWRDLSEKAQRYVALFHDHALWEQHLMDIFTKIATGATAMRPTASIILTVHDKEKHIVRLLEMLLLHTRSYPAWDLHIVYDGCTDASRVVAQTVLKDFPVPVYEYETPDIWEVKANNHGLRNASGKYCIILQDDNFIYEDAWLEKMLSWMEQHPKVGVLGGLAGVNFFHLDSDPQGAGVTRSTFELHQRLDPTTDTALAKSVFEADAVMRGPLILRKELLEKHGYLDEIYAPLYNDDMDYCFRMRSLGYGVFCYPIDVINENLTVAAYHDPEKDSFWKRTSEKNQQIFYKRWEADLEIHHPFQLRMPRPAGSTSPSVAKRGARKSLRENLSESVSTMRRVVRTSTRLIFLRLPAPLVQYVITLLPLIGARGRTLAELLHLHYFESKLIPWRQTNGDNTLRVSYPLHADSIIYSLGEKNGSWVNTMRTRYGSQIQHAPSEHSVSSMATSIEVCLKQSAKKRIDLLSLYLEGKEYALLNELVDTGFIEHIQNVQVKFSEHVPNAPEALRAIRKKLRVTHTPTYQYDFVWESWESKR